MIRYLRFACLEVCDLKPCRRCRVHSSCVVREVHSAITNVGCRKGPREVNRVSRGNRDGGTCPCVWRGASLLAARECGSTNATSDWSILQRHRAAKCDGGWEGRGVKDSEAPLILNECTYVPAKASRVGGEERRPCAVTECASANATVAAMSESAESTIVQRAIGEERTKGVLCVC